MTKEILVFVSSPGDCVAERASARRVIETLNTKPEIAAQGLRLRPLLWEDLPPGIADGGDFQKLIDGQIKRGGYAGYGIYIGIMKRRLGSRTPRHASGTVEEMEQSLKRRQRVGMPVEILFYFVDDGTPPDKHVEAFKQRMTRRGLLHAEVDSKIFDARLEQNLFDIAKSWSAWRTMVRRHWRPARNIAGTVAVAAAISLVAFDLTARYRIVDALAHMDISRAAEIWDSRRQLMPLSDSAMRRQISEAIAKRIGAADSISAAMSVFGRWQAEPVLSPHSRSMLFTQLRDGVSQEIRTEISANRTVLALSIWLDARRIGIWDSFPDDGASLIAAIAAIRMIEALSATGVAPETWADGLILPQQHPALAGIAGQIVAQDPALNAWPNRSTRTAIALLAGEIDVLGRLAQLAAQKFDTAEQPEIAAYIARAEPAALATWLEATIGPELPSHVVARIVDAVQDLENPDAMLKLLDLADRGRFPDPGPALLDGYRIIGADSAVKATFFLRDHAKAAPLHPAIIEMLLPHLDVSILSLSECEDLTEALLRNPGDGPTPKVIHALSQLDTQRARAAVAVELAAHLDGRTAFGFAHRVALMDHIRLRLPPDRRLATALKLFERSEEDRALIESPHSLNFGISIADEVERGYLEILALDALRATDADRAALTRIVERKLVQAPAGPLGGLSRLAGASGVSDDESQRALGAALRKLPEGWSIALLGYPPAPVVDPPWEPAWARREIVLAALAAAVGPSLEGVSATVLRGLPDDEAKRERLFGLAAAVGPASATEIAQDRLAGGDSGAIGILGQLGDESALRDHLARILSGAAPAGDLDRLVEALHWLSPSTRRAFLATIVAQFPEEAGKLLDTATEAGFSAESLDRAAEALLRSPEGGRAWIGLRYLTASDPGKAWRLVAEPDFLAWMARNETFDWVGVAQELPGAGVSSPPKQVAALAAVRTVLVAFENGGYAAEDATSGQLGVGAELGVVSHVLAILAASDDPATALQVLGGVRLSSVETMGQVPNPEVTARAYLTWLAVGPATAAPLGCMPPVWLSADQLDDANPLATRAAAALVLAQPSVAMLPTCPATNGT